MNARLKIFFFILLLSQIAHGLERKVNYEPNQQRFLDSSKISATTSHLARTVNEFFIGVLETGGLIPSVLKGSTFTNNIYGFVNRTGLLVVGAGLVGISGGQTTMFSCLKKIMPFSRFLAYIYQYTLYSFTQYILFFNFFTVRILLPSWCQSFAENGHCGEHGSQDTRSLFKFHDKILCES